MSVCTSFQINGKTGEWTLLGKKDPSFEQGRQMLKENEFRLYNGDGLGAKCTYVSLIS